MQEYRPKLEPEKPIASSITGKMWSATMGALGTGAIAGLGLAATVRGSIQGHRDLMRFKNYLEKNKNLQVKYERSDIPIMSYFDPKKNIVHSSADLAIGAHEFGHAQNYKAYQKILGEKGGKALGLAMYGTLEDVPIAGRFLSSSPLAKIPALGVAALPLLSSTVTKAIKGNNPNSKRYRIGENIEKHPGSVMAGAIAPKLIEEASASGRAIYDITKFMPKGRKLKEVGKAVAKLTPAFGTYVAAASLPVIGAWAYGKSKEKNMTKKAQDIINKIAAFTEHGKAIQKAKAKSKHFYAQEVEKANEKYPGLAFVKGTQAIPTLNNLQARRLAYKSQGPTYSLKAIVPAVGMGKKGREALNKVITEK